MIDQLRKEFNLRFSEEKYSRLLGNINSQYGHTPLFRVCETPIFIPETLKKQLLDACDHITSVVSQKSFKSKTESAFKKQSHKIPNEDSQTTFMALDFGICEDESGQLMPQLIELQGFPSLYFFQESLARAYQETYQLDSWDSFLGGHNKKSYNLLLKSIIVGDCDPKEVVLLEVDPYHQITQIDFYITIAELGIKIICISKLLKRGKKLYYKDESGRLVNIKRIYNRIIFDELDRKPEFINEFRFQDEVEVHWVGHPNWFYRISKFTLPIFDSPYIPKCFYLDQLDRLPDDLDQYVLKPLFSFAGAGVKLHVSKELVNKLDKPSNYILQKKVDYAPVLPTTDVPAKFEVRMMTLFNPATQRHEVVNNLIRVSKGEMIGVRYNKDKLWVGASAGLFQQ